MPNIRALAQFDLSILWFGCWRSFRTVGDRLTLGVLLAILCYGLYSQIEVLKHIDSLWVAAAPGFLVAIAAAGLIRRRLFFLQTESILAATALNNRSALLYAASYHELLCIAGFEIALMTGNHKWIAFIPGYLAGLIVSWAGTNFLAVVRSRLSKLRKTRPIDRSTEVVPRWHSVIAIMSSFQIGTQLDMTWKWGFFLSLSMLFGMGQAVSAFALPIHLAGTLIAITSGLTLLFLSRVDAQAVRMMNVVGLRPLFVSLATIIVPASFAAAAAVPLYLFAPWQLAVEQLAIGVLTVVILVFRGLAYSAFHKREADMKLTIAFSLLGTLGALSPFLVPFALVLIGWYLGRQGNASRWLAST